MKTRNHHLLASLLLLGLGHSAQAVPVDLNTWTAESYPAVAGFGAGVWTVTSGGAQVYQSVNGQPTLFYSDFNSFGTSFTGTIKAEGWDDDYIGFVLGYNPGDASNASADYLLIDWKRGTQYFNFGSPSNTPGSTAYRGLAVSRITGIPTADEFWGHTDFASDTGGSVTELARAFTLGSTGWVTGQTYDFTFDFGPNDLKVYVDGALELDISGSFNDGRFGFYNFSQASVTYSGFTKDPGSFPPPVSASAPPVAMLLLAGLAGIGFSRKRR